MRAPALTLLARPDAARVLVTLPRDQSTRRRATAIRDRYAARKIVNERKRTVEENVRALAAMWTESIPEAVQAARSFTFLDPAEISPQDRIEPRSLVHENDPIPDGTLMGWTDEAAHYRETGELFPADSAQPIDPEYETTTPEQRALHFESTLWQRIRQMRKRA